MSWPAPAGWSLLEALEEAAVALASLLVCLWLWWRGTL